MKSEAGLFHGLLKDEQYKYDAYLHHCDCYRESFGEEIAEGVAESKVAVFATGSVGIEHESEEHACGCGYNHNTIECGGCGGKGDAEQSDGHTYESAHGHVAHSVAPGAHGGVLKHRHAGDKHRHA